MTNLKISEKLKKYRTTVREKKKGDLFRIFEKRMVYRTTKTENPGTTMRMVNKVLDKIGHRAP